MKYFISSLFVFLLACQGCDNNVEKEVNENSGDDTQEVSPITWETCSQNVGDHPCNFSFEDKDGNEFNLYDNYGTIMILDFSTMWCGYCQVAAATVQPLQDQYGPYGFLYVTVLVEDVSGGTVEYEDAQEWADTYGILTPPVLVGDRSIVDMTAQNGYPISGWPTFVIIDENMVLTNGVNGWSEELIIQWIEEALAEELEE